MTLSKRRNLLKSLAFLPTFSISKTAFAANEASNIPRFFALNGVNLIDHPGYTISVFDGHAQVPTPKWPVIHGGTLKAPGGNSGMGPNDHVAWPSFMQLSGGVYRIIANRNYNNAWRDISIWESGNGVEFFLTGTAIELLPKEKDLGPGTVFLDLGSERPFKIMFQARKPKEMTDIQMSYCRVWCFSDLHAAA